MSFFFTHIVAPLLVGAIGYLCLNFVVKDIVEFNNLRRNILEEINNTANVYVGISDEHVVANAQEKLRRLSAKLDVLYNTANRIVFTYFTMKDYDLPTAATALRGLSNSLAQEDWHRASKRYKIEKSLKFPHGIPKSQIDEMRELALRRDND